MLPLAVMAAGLAVAAWVRAHEERSDELLGDRPAGPLADTRLALAAAFVLWGAAQVVLGVFLFPSVALPPPIRVAAVSLVHVAVALAVLRPALAWTRPRRRLAGDVARGVAGGLAAYGMVALVSLVLLAAYSLAGVAVPDQGIVEILRAAGPVGRTVLVFCAVVLAPFAEEVFYRGVLLPVFALALPLRRALVAQALLFGFVHFWQDPVAWPLSLAIAVVGWTAGWLYVRTGSLRAAILLHATFNALQVALLFATV